MAVHTYNGRSKVDRKVYRTTPQFITTIDFGTTHCSVAYLLRPDLESNPSEVDPTVLTLDNAGNKRIPSCILFDPSGNKIAFGYEAREQFAALDHEERPQYYYFEHVKKNLQHDKDFDGNQQISALNGKQFFLVDVIAHILHQLKDRLLTEVRDFGYKNLQASDINWVITVPAFWKSGGKCMMREAGYMAGLCSDSEPPPICIATGNHDSPQEEKSPEKLLLALEPESAAVHCQHEAKVAIKGSQYLVRAKKYLVVDIGGGTADIASHHIVGDRIEEIAPPAGNFWGGTTVNEEFSKFLQDFVDDPEFSLYIENSSTEKQTRHKVDLNKLLYTTFEAQKRRFGSGEVCKSYIVKFPRSFVKLYEDSLVRKGISLNSKGDVSVKVEDDGEVMRITDSKMKEFFQPAIDGIMDLIESYLQENKIASTIDTIYWVGGFGGCEYLRNQLEAVIETTFRGCMYQFPVPPEPELAVTLGVTVSHYDPSIALKRKADATYGTANFDAVLHCPHFKEFDEELNSFHAFVKRGEEICTNEVFVMTFSAREKNQKSATFPVYATFQKDVRSTTDKDVHKLGEVTVDMGGCGLDREIELVCDITHTEIHVQARDKTSGNVQTVVVDFLSSEPLVPPVHPAPKPPTPVVLKPSLSPSCTSPLIPATPPPLPKTVVLTTDTTVKEFHSKLKHQLTALQQKHNAEVEFLEDMRSFTKQRSAIEKKYAQSLQRLAQQFLNKKEIQSPPEDVGVDRTENRGLLEIWRMMLEKTDEIAKQHHGVAEVMLSQISEEMRQQKRIKEQTFKRCFEVARKMNSELLESVKEMNTTKKSYCNSKLEKVCEELRESDGERLHKKDHELLEPLTSLEESDYKSSDQLKFCEKRMIVDRNNYLLAIEATNAHLRRHGDHDLPCLMEEMDGELYEKARDAYIKYAQTECDFAEKVQEEMEDLREQAHLVNREYVLKCFVHRYPIIRETAVHKFEPSEQDQVHALTKDPRIKSVLDEDAERLASQFVEDQGSIAARQTKISQPYPDTQGKARQNIERLREEIRQLEVKTTKMKARLDALQKIGINVDQWLQRAEEQCGSQESSSMKGSTMPSPNSGLQKVDTTSLPDDMAQHPDESDIQTGNGLEKVGSDSADGPSPGCITKALLKCCPCINAAEDGWCMGRDKSGEERLLPQPSPCPSGQQDSSSNSKGNDHKLSMVRDDEQMTYV